jgi:hypothetical protein
MHGDGHRAIYFPDISIPSVTLAGSICGDRSYSDFTTREFPRGTSCAVWMPVGPLHGMSSIADIVLRSYFHCVRTLLTDWLTPAYTTCHYCRSEARTWTVKIPTSARFALQSLAKLSSKSGRLPGTLPSIRRLLNVNESEMVL